MKLQSQQQLQKLDVGQQPTKSKTSQQILKETTNKKQLWHII